MAGRGAEGGAQRGRARGGRHEPAAGAGASTDPDRCAPPPCDGPSGCAVPPAGSARARALARNFGRLALRDRAGRPGPAPRRLKRQLGERIFWRRSRPRWAPGAAAGGSGETARVGVARKRAGPAARPPPLGAAPGPAPCHRRPISRPKIYFIFEAIVEPLTLRQAVGRTMNRGVFKTATRIPELNIIKTKKRSWLPTVEDSRYRPSATRMELAHFGRI